MWLLPERATPHVDVPSHPPAHGFVVSTRDVRDDRLGRGCGAPDGGRGGLVVPVCRPLEGFGPFRGGRCGGGFAAGGVRVC